MAKTYFDEALVAQIVSDERNDIRSINHSIGQVQREAKSPLDVAIAYLRQYRGKFQIPEEHLAEPSGRASYRKPRQCIEQFRLLEERHVFDSHMFFFAHTYLNIPVWKSGVKITTKDAPTRVVSSVNTSRRGVDARLPPAEAIGFFQRRFPEDPQYPSSESDESSNTRDPMEQGILMKEVIGRALKGGFDFAGGIDKDEPMIRGRFYVYQYDKCERIDPHVEEALKSLSGSLQCVSGEIKHGKWYVVAEITFPYTTDDHGRVNLRVLVEPKTYSVLYLGVLAAEVSGYAFRLDPISSSGDDTLTHDQDNSRLNCHRSRVTLNNLDPPVNGRQQLTGKYVKLVEVHCPSIAAPTTPSGDGFYYHVRSNNFAAVSAYFHTNQVFEVIESLGFPIDTYFKNTRFPIAVDHRGFDNGINAHCVGDGRGGIGHVCYGIMDKTNVTEPLGRASDPRVHWHELCGHGVLYEALDSANFYFAHSAGDGISGIFFDPESGVRGRSLRFEYAPWHPCNCRRFDRDVAHGWAWGGKHDNQVYKSEEILATCHFRIYRAIGGDSGDLGQRKFASRVMIYLILRAIHNLTPATNPRYAREFADELMAVDRLNWTSEGMVGGAYNKVIRWSFEKQGEYQKCLVTRDDPRFGEVETAGSPPDQDVYIDDGRCGEYEYQRIFWNTTTIWNRRQPDRGELHQPPKAGTQNYAYVKVKNRGTQTACGVTVHAFHCRPTAGVSWPTCVKAATTPMIYVEPVQGDNSEERIVGPFKWTPTANGRGHDCIFMVVSSDQDPSNIDSLTAEEVMATWRLVPNDNNVAQRSLHVVPAGSPQALMTALDGASLWIRNPSLTVASMRLNFRLPDALVNKCWRLEVSNHDHKTFDLAPGAEEEITLRVTAGDDFKPTEIKAGCRDIVVEVLADDGLVGGITYRLNPNGSDTEETGIS